MQKLGFTQQAAHAGTAVECLSKGMFLPHWHWLALEDFASLFEREFCLSSFSSFKQATVAARKTARETIRNLGLPRRKKSTESIYCQFTDQLASLKKIRAKTADKKEIKKMERFLNALTNASGYVNGGFARAPVLR